MAYKALMRRVLRDRLKKILLEKGITAYRLGKDLGIDHGQLSRFFNGKENFSIPILEAIADYLGWEFTLRRKDAMKDINSSRRIAQREIKDIIEEFEKRHKGFYLADIIYSTDTGELELRVREGTIGKPKIPRPPEEPYTKRPKRLKWEEWKRMNRIEE